MQEAAAYIRRLQPDVVCMQEAPDASYYQMDSIRMAFDYVVYRYISGRTDHLPMMISSRYPLRAVRTLFFKNSVNLAMIADVCMPHDTVRVFCNHLETTSVNQYRGQIQAASKPWLFRLKAGAKLILQMKENFRKRAEQQTISPKRSVVPPTCRGMWRLQRYPRLLYLSPDERRADRWIPRCRQGYQYTFRQLKRIWRIDYIFYSDELKGISYDSPDTPYSDHKMVVWRGYKK